jgi:hypothetical protein
MGKYIDYIMFMPILILIIIVIGFLVAEWIGCMPVVKINSLLLLGQENSIKVL